MESDSASNFCEPMDVKTEDVKPESCSMGFKSEEDVKVHSNFTGGIKSEIPEFGFGDILEKATMNRVGGAAANWPKSEVCDDLSYDEFKWMYKNLNNDNGEKWKILNEKFRISSAQGGHKIKEEANDAISELKERLVGTYEQKLQELRSFSVSVALPNGRTISLTIRPFERVLSLKEQIQSTSGYSVKHQLLFDRQNQLQDDETLEQRLVVSGALFTMLLREQGFEIFVQGIATKLYLLRDLTPDMKVSQLKEKIQERENIEPCAQVLKFECRNLENNQTLKSCGVRQGSTISVTGRLRGGLF